MESGTLAVVTGELDGRQHLLLGEKQYGPDEGKFVLPGGKAGYGILPEHVQPATLLAHEHLDWCALRETREETGLDIRQGLTFRVGSLLVAAHTDYDGLRSQDWAYHIGIYRSHLDGYGVQTPLRPCDEIRPAWFALDDLPLDDMQADVPLWLPHAIRMANRRDSLYGSVMYDRTAGSDRYDIADYAIDCFFADDDDWRQERTVSLRPGQADTVTIAGSHFATVTAQR